jgi:hypothetical protein
VCVHENYFLLTRNALLQHKEPIEALMTAFLISSVFKNCANGGGKNSLASDQEVGGTNCLESGEKEASTGSLKTPALA